MNNWVMIVALLILGGAAINGMRKGFIESAYGLVVIVLSLILVGVLNPVTTKAIEENTNCLEVFQQKCYESLEKRYQREQEKKDEEEGEDREDKEDKIDNEEIKDTLANLLGWPSELNGFSELLLKNDGIRGKVYEGIAAKMAMWLLYGLSFLLTLLIVAVLLCVLHHALKIVSYLPVIHTANVLLGLLMGIIKGLLVLWLMSLIITLFSTTAWASEVIEQIYENPYLTFLYEHNVILQLLQRTAK